MTTEQTEAQKKHDREVFEQSVQDMIASYEQMYDELDLNNPVDVSLLKLHEMRALRVIVEPRLHLLESQIETQLGRTNEQLAQLNETLTRLCELQADHNEKGN